MQGTRLYLREFLETHEPWIALASFSDHHTADLGRKSLEIIWVTGNPYSRALSHALFNSTTDSLNSSTPFENSSNVGRTDQIVGDRYCGAQKFQRPRSAALRQLGSCDCEFRFRYQVSQRAEFGSFRRHISRLRAVPRIASARCFLFNAQLRHYPTPHLMFTRSSLPCPPQLRARQSGPTPPVATLPCPTY